MKDGYSLCTTHSCACSLLTRAQQRQQTRAPPGVSLNDVSVSKWGNSGSASAREQLYFPKIIYVDRKWGGQFVLRHTHTHPHPLSGFNANSRHGGLHVTPASAEVVSEFVQRIDAQFLSEVGVLLLFGGQDLPQCPDLLFQLDTDTKAETSRRVVTTPSSFIGGATHTLANS